MTATRGDALVHPIRPEEYDAVGEAGMWMLAVDPARHLYESMGFRREPILDFAPVPGEDLSPMSSIWPPELSGMSEGRRAFGAVPSCTWV